MRHAIPILLTLAITPVASAGLVLNGGFESGLSGWQSIGDALVVDAALGSNPTQGSFQALITTAADNGDFNNFSGTDAVSASALESFLGLAAGTLDPAFEGSALRQTFTADAGDILFFDLNFLTTEGSQNDFAFAVIAGLAPLSTLADTSSPLVLSGVVLDPIFGDPTFETGYRTFSFTFAASGTYTLGLGVADAGDEFLPSGLLIDNVRVQTGVTPVPEPSTLLCGLISIATGFTYVGISRRFRPHPRQPHDEN